ncbi:ABC-type branched-subunit amino acid transport system substrate-binding protein [Bradyrhizobium sp. AZCC 1578]|uniref:ABC transporter substrate-binding protein n=1 Tax=Bradyrhizobium sp. AZCC 1578 TaxID=3117027 RepID=UPI002FF07C2A
MISTSSSTPDKVKPYTIKLIRRDAKDLAGANACVAVQELLTQDNVDILTGWYDSPSAIASAPLVNAGKKPAVILNAGAAHIPNLSPYYVRVSFSNWHAGFSMGEAAAKTLQAKTAVVGYKSARTASCKGWERQRPGLSPPTTTMPKKEYGADAVPDFFAVGGYDGMAAIVHAIHATNGKSDPSEALAALKGWTHDSPRGPIEIDPVTRDVVMNEYLSEGIMQNGRLHQKVIRTIERVKDPCKELKIDPCRPH